MKLLPKSWNAHGIAAADGYNATIPIDVPMTPEPNIQEASVYQDYPVYGGKSLQSHYLILSFDIGTDEDKYNDLAEWFYSGDQDEHTLICQDMADSNKEWQIQAVSKGIMSRIAGLVKVKLYVANPLWQEANLNEEDWNLTASGDTYDFVVTGNQPTPPIIEYTPRAAKAGGYAHRAWRPYYNTTTLPFGESWYLLATMDTATEVAAGRMLASGYDLRVLLGKTELPCWLDGMNTAATKVWVTLPAHLALQFVTLSGTLGASHGATTTLQFKATAANATALGKMKAPGILYSQRGEAFAFTTIDVKKYQVTGVTPAARDTTMAAHSDGDVFRWIELDMTIVWGNASATNPTYSDEKKPLLDLTNSDNENWVLAVFYTIDGLRGGFKPFKFKGKDLSNWYTGPSGDTADPATEMGMAVKAYQYGSSWKPDTAEMEWRIYDPVGFKTITSITGQKRREGTTWPALVEFQKSTDGKKWTQIFNEATPASAASWVALASHSAISLSGTYQYLRFHTSGAVSVPPVANAAYFEVQAATLVRESTRLPGGSLQARVDNYDVALTITNETTGEAIGLTMTGTIDETITIDCEEETVTLADGSEAMDAISWNSKRTKWFNFAKGTTNTWRIDHAGVTDEDYHISWRGRTAG